MIAEPKWQKCNCYGYALGVDLVLHPGARRGGESEVYNWSGGLDKYPFIDMRGEELLTACRNDGLQTADSAGRKIAIFVHGYDDCIDYHFYRLDLDNTWSMKDSNSGKITVRIPDPVEYDRKLVGTQLATGILVREKFVGMLYLPSGDDMKTEWGD